MAEPEIPIPTGEIGSSGLRVNNGYLNEEFDPKLRGRRGAETLREMRDNSHSVGAGLHAIEIAIRSVAADVEMIPFSSDAGDKARADFAYSCLHDMSFSWDETLSEHLTMLTYGYALGEMVFRRRQGYNAQGALSSVHEDGLVGWAKIPLRGQETITRWNIDSTGGIHGAWQVAPPDFRERYLPIEKCLLFRVTREKNNPEGRSLFRNAVWAWYCSKRLTETMLIGAERDLSGLAVVRIPSKLMREDATEGEKAVYEAYKALGRDIRRGDQEAVVLPSDRPEGGQHYHYDLQLLASGGKREFNVPEMVAMFDRWIATVLLTDLLLMGHGSGGGWYGLDKGKSGMFERSLNGYLETIDSIYNRHALPRLMRLNGWPANRAPKMRHRKLRPQDLGALADYLSKLTGAGLYLFPDEDLAADLLKRADLPPTAGGGMATLEKRIEALGALVRAGYVYEDALDALGLPRLRRVKALPVTLQGEKAAPRNAGGEDEEEGA